MGLDRYLSAVIRRWYLVALLALVGAVGTYGYFFWNGKTTVAMSVAVWEPAVVRGGNAQQAQLSFAPVVQSHLVAERVVKKLGLAMSADAVQGEVKVTLAKSLVPTLVTPLYVVSVSDRDPERARQILAATVDEGRQVFAELNGIDPAQVDAAFAPNEARLRAQLAAAQNDLRQFEEANNAYGLPSRIDSQAALVSSLQQDVRSIRSGTRGAALAQEKQDLLEAQKRLEELRALQPENDRLGFNVVLAAHALEQLAIQQNGITGPSAAAADAQVSRSKARLNEALAALAAYQRANGVSDLPSEIATQTSLMNNLLQLRQQIDLTRRGPITQDQIAGARLAIDQAKNAAFAAQAQRDGVCGNPQNARYQCEVANAQVNAATTGIQQAELALKAINDNASLDEITANVDKALATSRAELDRLRRLLPEYERLALEVSFASGTVTQSLSRGTDLAFQPSPSTLRGEIAAAQDRLDQARAAQAAFQNRNGIGNLAGDIAAQQTLVNDLQRQVLASAVGSAGRDQAITTEQAELNRLSALRPQYDQLAARIATIQNEITQLQASKLSLLVSNTLLPNAEIKVLDSPRVQPNTFWTIALYVLSTTFGALVGLVVVYVIAYFDQTPRSLGDVESLVGAPVLVRLPRAS